MFNCPESARCLRTTSKLGTDQPLSWIHVVKLYPDPQQCLASYLALWSAEVLAAVKPANLVRINNRTLPCGRNIYQLWRESGESFITASPLQYLVLEETDGGILLLLYHPELLQRRLAGRTMQVFLSSCGYPCRLNLKTALNHLQKRCRTTLPDEIGLFLGYPLKDVKGFIRKKSQPWSGRSLWRIYGPARRSLSLHESYRQARIEIITQLARRIAPLKILQAA